MKNKKYPSTQKLIQLNADQQAAYLEKHLCQAKAQDKIILIGMPGCGKTHVAQLISQALGLSLADTDQLIEGMQAESIPSILESRGESYFRQIETQALEVALASPHRVIATGGGIITQERNYQLVKDKHLIVWIKRPLDQLETAGRPLSQIHTVEKLYQERRPLYKRWADLLWVNE